MRMTQRRHTPGWQSRQVDPEIGQTKHVAERAPFASRHPRCERLRIAAAGAARRYRGRFDCDPLHCFRHGFLPAYRFPPGLCAKLGLAATVSPAMNEMSGAEAFVRMLELFGVEHIFGLCGDTSLPFYDALYRHGRGITHVLTRDERSAAYMADGYARVSGRVGVCEGPSGGGATYILPGVVEASESSIPVLAVTTDISVGGRGRYTLTELDQEALFRPLTKWNRIIHRAADIPRTVRAAFTQMTSGRPGAAHIGLPYDIQREPVDEREIWGDERLGRVPSRRFGPDPAAIEAAAALLLAAKSPLFICGGGVVIAGAEAELEKVAEWLGAPVASTVSGHGSLADTHPLAAGVVGSNGGTMPTRAIVATADLVVFVGCRAGSVTTERWRFPAPGKVKVIHLDADPALIGANYPTAVAIVSDARLALAELRRLLAQQPQPAAVRDL